MSINDLEASGGGDEGAAWNRGYDMGWDDGFAHAQFIVSEFWTILTSPKFCASHEEMIKIDGYFRALRTRLDESKERVELVSTPQRS